ncbi:ACP S-malonyltransferase [Priestia megaterium]|uniref:ACP S-malonyltransferase n=1 Tax=Priestia megaterium TaxID=1404 RepID=UPI000BEC236A|nr:ACP S-malonyltransferase [Priestia megaterium]PEA37021.1 [acyl-carrier-protein] S-malonyltransferase [Priestia megaterium]PEE48976.1 [acyl-carrier-protein] S-malonyltransferase [Priestia megaterium]
MSVFIFPGQGSQRKGMGGALFDEFPEITAKADQILGYSIKELCLENPNQCLNETKYTQPAMYTVNALSYLKKIEKTGKKPNFVAGHSLGEYNALFASGAFSFETGLKMVKRRGELMNEVTGGGMAAVIGLNEEQITDILKENDLESIDIANYNSPNQIVISGLKTDLNRAKLVFEEKKSVQKFVLLNTSGAFHSRYLEEARREFRIFVEYLNDFEFFDFAMPVISNIRARPYKQDEIKYNLTQQITHPVKWTESMKYLMNIGEVEFEEIGTGKVLTLLVEQIKLETEQRREEYGVGWN